MTNHTSTYTEAQLINMLYIPEGYLDDTEVKRTIHQIRKRILNPLQLDTEEITQYILRLSVLSLDIISGVSGLDLGTLHPNERHWCRNKESSAIDQLYYLSFLQYMSIHGWYFTVDQMVDTLDDLGTLNV